MTDIDQSTYKALCAYGFNPAKAYEIALDAARKDPYALKWVEVVKQRTG